MAVRLEKEGNVGVIVLDRPPANGYDHAFLREFASAIDDARLDGDVRNVVVTSSSEKFFCAGADVSVFASGTPRSRFMIPLLAHEAFRKMETSPLVFIAAISGSSRAPAARSACRGASGWRKRLTSSPTPPR